LPYSWAEASIFGMLVKNCIACERGTFVHLSRL
jgi:hypothetical protein